jgi:hypothetical protein
MYEITIFWRNNSFSDKKVNDNWTTGGLHIRATNTLGNLKKVQFYVKVKNFFFLPNRKFKQYFLTDEQNKIFVSNIGITYRNFFFFLFNFKFSFDDL